MKKVYLVKTNLTVKLKQLFIDVFRQFYYLTIVLELINIVNTFGIIIRIF